MTRFITSYHAIQNTDVHANFQNDIQNTDDAENYFPHQKLGEYHLFGTHPWRSCLHPAPQTDFCNNWLYKESYFPNGTQQSTGSGWFSNKVLSNLLGDYQR
jgi:hypothetical protein